MGRKRKVHLQPRNQEEYTFETTKKNLAGRQKNPPVDSWGETITA
jgi:hypothetical protein